MSELQPEAFSFTGEMENETSSFPELESPFSAARVGRPGRVAGGYGAAGASFSSTVSGFEKAARLLYNPRKDSRRNPCTISTVCD
jgi:hypothetical protein